MKQKSLRTNQRKGAEIDISKYESHELYQALAVPAQRFIEESLDRVFKQRGEFFVHELIKKISKLNLISKETVLVQAGDPSDWIEIESLSRLRALVGGRFQNLKKRWEEAGFPLREHKGDKGKELSLDEKGWIELSNWIMQQGYEARLTPEKPRCLFELRSLRK